jgi:putative redox protein
MATIQMKYLGGLRTKSTHIKSGTEIMTDAPTDNKGKGELFSPTDLVANALGSCIATIIAQAADTHNFNIDGTDITITKVMISDPRRIGEIIVELNFPHNNYSDKTKKIIENAAKTCPVAKSLHPDLIQTLLFNF